MAFSALTPVWRAVSTSYKLLVVNQSAGADDITISASLSSQLTAEMRASLLTLCDTYTTLHERADIIEDAINDIAVTTIGGVTITSSVGRSDDNRSIYVQIPASATVSNSYVYMIMPSGLVGLANVTSESPADILLATGVTPGTYTNATITVRSDGRVSFAATGSGGGGDGGGGSGGASLTPSSVITAYLADYAVTTIKLSDAVVTTAKIQNSAVTDAKINSVSASKVTGLSTVGLTGSYTDLSNKPDLSGKLDASAAASTYATKDEVAAIQQGVAYKAAVDTRVASVSAATTYLAANNGARVLVDSGSPAAANGIYVYDAASGYKRSTDFDGDPLSEISAGAMVFVEDTGVAYICNSADAPTVVNGVVVSNISWTPYSKAEVLSASNGISRSGNALSLDTTSSAFLGAVPYDVYMGFTGCPVLNEVLFSVKLTRAITLAGASAHAVQTLAVGERPATNGDFQITVYNGAASVFTFTYQADGTAVVAQTGSTSFAAGDSLLFVCTAYSSSARNPSLTLSGSLA